MTPLRARSAPLVLMAALVAGLLWGALARAWMRLISTEPEFSWDGTLFIVGAFGVAALTQSMAFLVVRSRPGPWWRRAVRRLLFVGVMPVVFGPGIVMFPTVVLGGLALSHPRWRRWVRVPLAVVAAAPVVFTVGEFPDLPAWRAVVGALGLVVVYGAVVWAAGASLGARPTQHLVLPCKPIGLPIVPRGKTGVVGSG